MNIYTLQDPEWESWTQTPESTLAILQQPLLGIRPSDRTKDEKLLVMILDIKRKWNNHGPV
jgi:hypothetical protein